MGKIGFIGAGKVGNALAQYLHQHHHTIQGVYSTSESSAVNMANSVHAKAYPGLLSLVKDVELLFITTPDDVIQSVSREISKLTLDLTGKTICHCSGALSSEILLDCHKKGAVTASIHPLQAFTGSEQDVINLKNTFFTIDASDQENHKIHQLLTSLGNPFKWIASERKSLYHGAAVLTSNYMVTLIEEALTYMRLVGIDDTTALDMLLPLMTSTIENVRNKGTIHGLTGPIVRGDQGIVAAQLAQINEDAGTEAADFYKLMGRHTIRMIQNHRIDQSTYDAFNALFKE